MCCFKMSERGAVARCRLGNWKLKGIERGRCPLRYEDENESHVCTCDMQKGKHIDTIIVQ